MLELEGLLAPPHDAQKVDKAWQAYRLITGELSRLHAQQAAEKQAAVQAEQAAEAEAQPPAAAPTLARAGTSFRASRRNLNG